MKRWNQPPQQAEWLQTTESAAIKIKNEDQDQESGSRIKMKAKIKKKIKAKKMIRVTIQISLEHPNDANSGINRFRNLLTMMIEWC